MTGDVRRVRKRYFEVGGVWYQGTDIWLRWEDWI